MKLQEQSSNHNDSQSEHCSGSDNSDNTPFASSLNGFLQIEDEILETNQCACIITFDSTDSALIIECTANIPDFDSSPHSSSAIISTLYLSASDQFHVPQQASMVFTPMQTSSLDSFPSYVTSIDSVYPTFAATRKRYKPVTQK